MKVCQLIRIHIAFLVIFVYSRSLSKLIFDEKIWGCLFHTSKSSKTINLVKQLKLITSKLYLFNFWPIIIIFAEVQILVLKRKRVSNVLNLSANMYVESGATGTRLKYSCLIFVVLVDQMFKTAL